MDTKEGTFLICNAIQTVAPRQIYMPQSQSVTHPVINSELRKQIHPLVPASTHYKMKQQSFCIYNHYNNHNPVVTVMILLKH